MPKNNLPNKIDLFLAVLFIVAIVYLCFIPSQQEFVSLIIPYILGFTVYFYIITSDNINFGFWLIIAFLVRIILVFSFPNLSDDIYRFAWDGRLVASGMSPYALLPEALLDQGVVGINQELFDPLNSKPYFSVYPPINQIFFWLPAVLSNGSIFWHSIITKLMMLIAEFAMAIGLIRILTFFKLPKEKALVYLLNPLIIVEVLGNMHFEGVMICFFIWSMVMLYENRYVLSSILLALSIGVKLVPIFFIPIIAKYLWKNPKRNTYAITLICCGILIGLPLILGVNWQNFGKSIDLYFQKFEFNASLYYLLRWVGKLLTGYNMIYYIGPFLGVSSLSFILYLGWTRKIITVLDLMKYAMIGLSFYYFSTTTVHPWYMSFLIAFSVFVPYKYAIVWSSMIPLSYIHYNTGLFQENYLLIAIEYVVVACFLWKDFGSNIKSRFKLDPK